MKHPGQNDSRLAKYIYRLRRPNTQTNEVTRCRRHSSSPASKTLRAQVSSKVHAALLMSSLTEAREIATVVHCIHLGVEASASAASASSEACALHNRPPCGPHRARAAVRLRHHPRPLAVDLDARAGAAGERLRKGRGRWRASGDPPARTEQGL